MLRGDWKDKDLTKVDYILAWRRHPSDRWYVLQVTPTGLRRPKFWIRHLIEGDFQRPAFACEIAQETK